MANGWGAGQHESYKANDVQKTEWLFGSGPCDFGCEQADGEVVALGEDFPGIDCAYEPAHPNCTCTTIPYLED